MTKLLWSSPWLRCGLPYRAKQTNLSRHFNPRLHTPANFARLGRPRGLPPLLRRPYTMAVFFAAMRWEPRWWHSSSWWRTPAFLVLKHRPLGCLWGLGSLGLGPCLTAFAHCVQSAPGLAVSSYSHRLALVNAPDSRSKQSSENCGNADSTDVKVGWTDRE